MHEMVRKAMHFATQAHRRIDQRRKYTHQPYEAHLRAVAELVAEVTQDPETIAAAWLHDVVEDTPATFEDIEREFGAEVRRLVAEVTDVSRPADGNRAARKARDREHLARASSRAQTVKLADLIDNCRDICRHDERFGRVFVEEMAQILEVLHEGEVKLQRRARKVLESNARRLGVPLAAAGDARVASEPRIEAMGQHRAWKMFAHAFAARDVAEPLRSFDGERDAQRVRERMQALGLDVVGVRRDGEVLAYARSSELVEGSCEACSRPFESDQSVDAEASLTEVIRVLTRHEYGFVTTLGAVNGVLARRDMQKPLVRMWLFGMITLVEMTLVERIRTRWPDEGWVGKLTETRLRKARELQAERERRGDACELLDCLQLGDKATLLLSDPEELAAFGFESRKSARRVVQELQSLRNNLAHSQDIVTRDWPQIARMTARIEAMVE